MIVDAMIDFDSVEVALAKLGATIVWPEGKRTMRSFRAEVDVDDDEAADALPSRYFERDEDEWVKPADDHDVRDFISACASGDRQVAIVISHRIFSNDRQRDVAERTFLQLGGVA